MRWIVASAALVCLLAQAQRTQLAGARAGETRTVGGMALRWCPPGEFLMGSPALEPLRRGDEQQAKVVISRGFWIGQYEVTQAQWRRVAGEFPQPMNKGAGPDFPVYWVSYEEAERFSSRLTQIARAARQIDDQWEFRLPTEAQWEYACRAGTTTATAFGDRLSRSDANFNGEPYNGGKGGPAPGMAVKVGSYLPNAWGIHDMHGNIFEWVLDWYHSHLPGGTDPDLSDVRGVRNRDGSYSRVRRGGAWNDPGAFLRSALRLRYEPARRSDHIGFRVVVVPR